MKISFLKVKLGFVCSFVFLLVVNGQVKNQKNVILVSSFIVNSGISQMKISGVVLESEEFKSFILRESVLDSVEFELTYMNLFFKKKVRRFKYGLGTGSNYFKIKNVGYPAHPVVVEIKEEDLIRLKKRKSIKKKMEEFGLE